MILTCPQCSTRYQVDGAKFPSTGRNVRCAKCGHVWHQLGPMAEVNKFFRANGLYTFVRWNNFFVNPPLMISKEHLLEGLDIIDRALEITDDSVID